MAIALLEHRSHVHQSDGSFPVYMETRDISAGTSCFEAVLKNSG